LVCNSFAVLLRSEGASCRRALDLRPLLQVLQHGDADHRRPGDGELLREVVHAPHLDAFETFWHHKGAGLVYISLAKPLTTSPQGVDSVRSR